MLVVLGAPLALSAPAPVAGSEPPIQCAVTPMIGKFDPARDLFVAAFDAKTDTDDFHSVAALATMLADPRLTCVDYVAVAGAYGKQEGDHLPAPRLFDLAFGKRWTDAHSDRAKAMDKVVAAALRTLDRGGHIWVQEAGQSDFSALVVQRIKTAVPTVDTRARVTIVQHSVWNERETTPAALDYVRAETRYFKIPDGNTLGNGTPGFKTPDGTLWAKALGHPRTGAAWAEARKLAADLNNYNGWHDNAAIGQGGFDFSDTAEAVWIFGFDAISDAEDFFTTFASVDVD